MTPDVRAFLTAVLDAIDIPAPATFGDHKEYARLLEDRAFDAVVALHGALDEPLADSGWVDWHTAYLRKQLAKKPPTGYRHWASAADGAQEGGA